MTVDWWWTEQEFRVRIINNDRPLYTRGRPLVNINQISQKTSNSILILTANYFLILSNHWQLSQPRASTAQTAKHSLWSDIVTMPNCGQSVNLWLCCLFVLFTLLSCLSCLTRFWRARYEGCLMCLGGIWKVISPIGGVCIPVFGPLPTLHSSSCPQQCQDLARSYNTPGCISHWAGHVWESWVVIIVCHHSNCSVNF